MSSRTSKAETLRHRSEQIRAEEAQLREGGGKAGQERQHKLGRLVARERLARLLDPDGQFFEIGLWAASFATTPSFPPPAYRSLPPSWAIVSPVAHICRCYATRF